MTRLVAEAPPISALAAAITSRDFSQLADVFDPKIEFRALTPAGSVEAAGTDETIEWFVEWFGRGYDQELVLNETFAMGARTGLRFRLRRKLGKTAETAKWYLIEQDCFADVGPLGVERLSLVCSGHTPEAQPEAPAAVHEFDAGDLGCADGLPQEFLRQIRSVAIGDVLHITCSDPSARQDLPSLARMNGQLVEHSEELADGRTLFIVKRCK